MTKKPALSSGEVSAKIIRLCGLDPEQVTKIEISIEHNDFVNVKAEFHPFEQEPVDYHRLVRESYKTR